MTYEGSTIEDLDPCPDEDILRLYAEGRAMAPIIGAAIKAHLQFCTACRGRASEFRSPVAGDDKIVQTVARRLKERQDAIRKRAKAIGIAPGSIWRTAGPESPGEFYGPMVLILKNRTGIVRVAEVSEKIDQALDTDFILSPRESGLSFPCMIRSENIFESDSDFLKTFVVHLPPMLVRRSIWFCNLGASLDENVPLAQYVFFEDAKGTPYMQRRGVMSGMPATSDDDARLAFLKESIRHCEYLHIADLGRVADADFEFEDVDFYLAPDEDFDLTGDEDFDLVLDVLDDSDDDRHDEPEDDS
jgi:hypothetical protein